MGELKFINEKAKVVHELNLLLTPFKKDYFREFELKYPEKAKKIYKAAEVIEKYKKTLTRA